MHLQTLNKTRFPIELARSKGLSKNVDEILEKRAKTIARVGEYTFTAYGDLFKSKPLTVLMLSTMLLLITPYKQIDFRKPH
ncbi:MAG: hypothetical protein WAM26_13430 [Nitrososphaeraceae archaeon]